MVLRFFGHDFLEPLALSLTFTRGRWLFHWCFLQGMPPLLWCTADLAQCLDWRPGMWPAVSRFRGIWRKKRDVFWILKIYVEYKIKRRFNKNGCVVFHCVFVGHVFFFEMWEWLFFLCQVQKRSRFRHQELLALEVSLDIPVIGLNSGCATSRPGQSSQALSFNRMKGANVRRSSSGTC